MEAAQVLIVDSSYLSYEKSASKQICLNFQINNPEQGVAYSIRLSLQNSPNPTPIPLGYTLPQVPDMNGTILFNVSFIIDYYFEKKQTLIIEIAKQNGQNFKMDTTIGAIIGAKGNTVVIPFEGRPQEAITITGGAVNKSDVLINFDVTVTNGFGNLFYVIKKKKIASDKSEFFAVYKSEISSLKYNTFTIPSSYLDYGDHNNSIAFEIYADNNLIDMKETTINNLLQGQNTFIIGDYNVVVMVTETQRSQRTFLDLIKQNLQLNLEIGIDFTGSNGNYRCSSSLHYLSSNPNYYECAIRECGDILSYYDSDKIYPVYGFGALVSGTTSTSHCFPLNRTNNPDIHGIDNVLKVYRETLPNLTFSGPTYFAPLIRTILGEIRKGLNVGFNYHIILILTDGVINDMDDTIDQIVEASELPVSIIIVGVGNANFSNMKILDGDDKQLKSKRTGKVATRDIVQFVPYSAVSNDPKKLAESVLEELPGQVENYYNNYKK